MLALTLQPKFESACGAANKLIMDKLEVFLADEEARCATDQARMSINIAKYIYQNPSASRNSGIMSPLLGSKTPVNPSGGLNFCFLP